MYSGNTSYKLSNVYIDSSNRTEIDKKVNKLYRKDIHRKVIIEKLLGEQLDKRMLTFEKIRLPAVSVYDNNLAERTVKASLRLLEFKL